MMTYCGSACLKAGAARGVILHKIALFYFCIDERNTPDVDWSMSHSEQSVNRHCVRVQASHHNQTRPSSTLGSAASSRR